MHNLLGVYLNAPGTKQIVPSTPLGMGRVWVWPNIQIEDLIKLSLVTPIFFVMGAETSPQGE